MPDTGFLFPGTAVGNRPVTSSIGDWTTPNNIKADDAADAEITIGSFSPCRGLAASNFDFSSIPAGSSIDGIEVRLGDYIVDNNQATRHSLRLILSDNSDGTENKATGIPEWNTFVQTAETGGATDLWTETIELSDVLNSNFGWFVNAEDLGTVIINVDYMQMKVYYTEPPETEPLEEAWAVNMQRNRRKVRY